jgi:hypothetical protein
VWLLAALWALPGCVEESVDHRGPYLSWTRDPRTTMTLTWETRSPVEVTLRYGEAGAGLPHERVVPAPDRRRDDRYYHYEITLRDLKPGQRYEYQVTPLQPEPVSFHTAPGEATGSFRFLLYGDSRERRLGPKNQHQDLVEAMQRDHDLSELAFALNTGDLVQTHNSVSSWDVHFEVIRPLASRMPYLVASGNHDWRPDLADPSKQYMNRIHAYPDSDHPSEAISGLGETSYAFGYSCAYVIALGVPHVGRTGDGPVNQWLAEQLAIGESGYDFTFVAFHRPPFDRRAGGYEDAVDVLAHQAQLFHQAGVDAVFNGHNHVLAVQRIRYDPTVAPHRDPEELDPDVRSLPYVIAGGGGADLRDAHPGTWSNRHGFGFHGATQHAASVYHYYVAEVDCDEGRATLTPYDREGEQPHEPLTILSHW